MARCSCRIRIVPFTCEVVMKKIVALIGVVFVVLSLSGCGRSLTEQKLDIIEREAQNRREEKALFKEKELAFEARQLAAEAKAKAVLRGQTKKQKTPPPREPSPVPQKQFWQEPDFSQDYPEIERMIKSTMYAREKNFDYWQGVSISQGRMNSAAADKARADFVVGEFNYEKTLRDRVALDLESVKAMRDRAIAVQALQKVAQGK